MSVKLRSALQPYLNNVGLKNYYADMNSNKQLCIFTSCGKSVYKVPGVYFDSKRISVAELKQTRTLFEEYITKDIASTITKLDKVKQNLKELQEKRKSVTVFKDKRQIHQYYDGSIGFDLKERGVEVSVHANTFILTARNRVNFTSVKFTAEEKRVIQGFWMISEYITELQETIENLTQKLNTCDF